MANAVMQQCDLLDGLEDGILNDPLACEVDVDQFACKGRRDGQGA